MKIEWGTVVEILIAGAILLILNALFSKMLSEQADKWFGGDAKV